MHKYRTHNCSSLTKSDVSKTVKLAGWVHSKRDHGSLIFIDLRDHFGLTQCVIDQQNTSLNLDEIAAIKLESVILVTGTVVQRAAEAVNPNIKTGEIEVRIENLVIESLAEQIPFQINDHENYPEELRL
jgi:aspartyl-tRNA synthetase